MTLPNGIAMLVLALGLFWLGQHLGSKAAWASITKAQIVTATKADKK